MFTIHKENGMNKEEVNQIMDILNKYNFAISGCLYPSQVETLYEALIVWINEKEMIEIYDSFTNLAFRMIVCDLIHQERTKNAEREE